MRKIFSVLFTAIRSFSTDFIIAFFGGTGNVDDLSLLSTKSWFRLPAAIDLLDVFLLTDFDVNAEFSCNDGDGDATDVRSPNNRSLLFSSS